MTRQQTARSWAAKRPYMVRRILTAYDAASAADLAAGVAWYARAQHGAAELSAGTAISAEHAAGIIAALSPRTRWAQNLSWAARMIDAAAEGAIQPPKVHTTAMRAVAWKIAQGTAPLDALNGPKTRAFYKNITGDTEAVTVDVWAAAIAEGTIRPYSNGAQTNSGVPHGAPAPIGGRYNTIEQAYREAAHLLGDITPRDLQAAVWVAARGSAE